MSAGRPDPLSDRIDRLEDQTARRLGAIEDKLDKLVIVIGKFARVEERVASVFRLHDSATRHAADLADRVRKLETALARSGASLGHLDKLLWSVIGFLLSIVVFFVTKGSAP